jgi:protein-S-isoprenylcysteine O-methyltransferase Ste14
VTSLGDEQTPPSRPDVEGSSIGELLGRVTGDLSTLMRQELELAKAELRQEAAKAGRAGGMLGGAGAVGYLTLVFFALALMFALGNVMDLGWAAVIVGVLLAIAAAALFVLGRKQLRQVNPKPEQTIETVKEDVQWARTRTS